VSLPPTPPRTTRGATPPFQRGPFAVHREPGIPFSGASCRLRDITEPAATTAGEPHSETKEVRIVIVEDHALVREGTAELLEATPDLHVVGDCGTAEEGAELVETLAPDVVLVDVNLPGASGLALARDLARRSPTTRTLVVSAYDDHAYVTEALEIGVGGYLLKTASGRELTEAVRLVAAGVFVLDGAVSSRLSRRRREAVLDRRSSDALTPRESEVLALITRGRSNKQIAAELSLGVRTVESHVSTLLAKLGAASRTEAVAHALWGKGSPRSPGDGENLGL
jgi:DNA-binding NarL/FixJ family response regulator